MPAPTSFFQGCRDHEALFNALSLEKFVLDADLVAVLGARGAPPAAVRTPSPRTSSTPSAPGGCGYLGQALNTRRHARHFQRPGQQAPETFERWVTLGVLEDSASVAARRVGELLDAHEPPDDLDAG